MAIENNNLRIRKYVQRDHYTRCPPLHEPHGVITDVVLSLSPRATTAQVQRLKASQRLWQNQRHGKCEWAGGIYANRLITLP